MRVDGTVTATCASSLDESTISELERGIYLSADDNPVMKDVYFRGTCAEEDQSAHGMLIYLSSEAQCYENVHPDYLYVA